MTDDQRLWHGLYGGATHELAVGDWIVDQPSGKRGQIERLLGDNWVLLRLESGESVRVQLRPA